MAPRVDPSPLRSFVGLLARLDWRRRVATRARVGTWLCLMVLTSGALAAAEPSGTPTLRVAAPSPSPAARAAISSAASPTFLVPRYRDWEQRVTPPGPVAPGTLPTMPLVEWTRPLQAQTLPVRPWGQLLLQTGERLTIELLSANAHLLEYRTPAGWRGTVTTAVVSLYQSTRTDESGVTTVALDPVDQRWFDEHHAARVLGHQGERWPGESITSTVDPPAASAQHDHSGLQVTLSRSAPLPARTWPLAHVAGLQWRPRPAQSDPIGAWLVTLRLQPARDARGELPRDLLHGAMVGSTAEGILLDHAWLGRICVPYPWLQSVALRRLGVSQEWTCSQPEADRPLALSFTTPAPRPFDRTAQQLAAFCRWSTRIEALSMQPPEQRLAPWEALPARGRLNGFPLADNAAMDPSSLLRWEGVDRPVPPEWIRPGDNRCEINRSINEGFAIRIEQALDWRDWWAPLSQTAP